MDNKIIVMGLGRIFNRYKHLIELDELVCYLDNDCDITECDGYPVINNKEVHKYNYDYIVIFSINLFEAMAEELVWKYGVNPERIVSFQWYYKEFLCQNQKKIADSFGKIIRLSGIKSIFDIDEILAKYAMYSHIKNMQVDSIYNKKNMFLNRLYNYSYKINVEIAENIKNISRKYDIVLIDISKHNISMKYMYSIFEITNCIILDMNKDYVDRFDKDILDKLVLYNVHGYIFGALLKNKLDISIYQVAHKSFCNYNSDMYNSIWVGNKLDIGKEDITDSTGDNIADINGKINELTALYWMWKNTTDNIIGLNHYRRCFKSVANDEYAALNRVEIVGLLNRYDFIIAEGVGATDKPEIIDIRNSVESEAFDMAWKVLKDYFKTRSKEEYQAMEYVFNNQIIYPCNMFITKKKNMDKFCEWLFPISFYMVENVKINEKWDDYSKRIIGFLMERMLTVWLALNDYSICELPIIFLE